jgi:hypothetical protein
MQKTATTETTAIENSDNTAEGQYACPMHPEVWETRRGMF